MINTNSLDTNMDYRRVCTHSCCFGLILYLTVIHWYYIPKTNFVSLSFRHAHFNKTIHEISKSHSNGSDLQTQVIIKRWSQSLSPYFIMCGILTSLFGVVSIGLQEESENESQTIVSSELAQDINWGLFDVLFWTIIAIHHMLFISYLHELTSYEFAITFTIGVSSALWLLCNRIQDMNKAFAFFCTACIFFLFMLAGNSHGKNIDEDNTTFSEGTDEKWIWTMLVITIDMILVGGNCWDPSLVVGVFYNCRIVVATFFMITTMMLIVQRKPNAID